MEPGYPCRLFGHDKETCNFAVISGGEEKHSQLRVPDRLKAAKERSKWDKEVAQTDRDRIYLPRFRFWNYHAFEAWLDVIPSENPEGVRSIPIGGWRQSFSFYPNHPDHTSIWLDSGYNSKIRYPVSVVPFERVAVLNECGNSNIEIFNLKTLKREAKIEIKFEPPSMAQPALNKMSFTPDGRLAVFENIGEKNTIRLFHFKESEEPDTQGRWEEEPPVTLPNKDWRIVEMFILPSLRGGEFCSIVYDSSKKILKVVDWELGSKVCGLHPIYPELEKCIDFHSRLVFMGDGRVVFNSYQIPGGPQINIYNSRTGKTQTVNSDYSDFFYISPDEILTSTPGTTPRYSVWSLKSLEKIREGEGECFPQDSGFILYQFEGKTVVENGKWESVCRAKGKFQAFLQISQGERRGVQKKFKDAFGNEMPVPSEIAGVIAGFL